MPSHCRSGLGMGPVHLHPFSFARSSMIHHNNFDIHRAYQVDSCTSTFQPVKDDPSPVLATPLLQQQQQQQQAHAHAQQHSTSSGAVLNPANVEEVDVETILQLGELQDWTWPGSVEAHEAKPSELSLPYPTQSLISSTIIHPAAHADMHHDQKGSTSTSSLFGPPAEPSSQSFDLQSWCSGVRSVQSPHIAIPKFLANGGFSTSAEPSPTTDTSPLRLDGRERCSPATTPQHPAHHQQQHQQHQHQQHQQQRRFAYNSEHTEKALCVQKKWQGKRAVSQRESHIWSERQRRKGMNHLFSTLRSLLPQPTSKTDKSTVVSEIIKYIQGLQVKLDELQKKRAEILRRKSMDVTMVGGLNSPTSGIATSVGVGVAVPLSLVAAANNECCLQSFVLPNVALHISGNNAFITMSSPKKRGLFCRILLIMQSHKLAVLNAHISTSNATVFHCLHVMTPEPGCDFPKEALQTALQNLTLPDSAL
ncbi:protein MpBHLH24 [Marchantia polymorpha subsp. ruderalis]|uniref:BHLH domain-containing protein n=1 Tax=Marchantia polymorpha TaxID=3197 RepID=A0A2R6XJJ4_MARPO|nr:hypothetical protein MARPO_0012s0202 [Marchantia polymorpha]BBN18636.1 hypothetical protein Mp_8g04130 [Marchantia polymorpha subsp. ruderalis]|eukprot:PTQ46284.1 hypothetical protein MARPO_0012s0202 [Marchantia polymorpha]